MFLQVAASTLEDSVRRVEGQQPSTESSLLMKNLRHEYTSFKRYSVEPLLSTLPTLFNPVSGLAGVLDGKVSAT